MLLLSSELPPGKVHLLRRHPNAEPVRLNEGDAVFSAQGEWHGVRTTPTSRP